MSTLLNASLLAGPNDTGPGAYAFEQVILDSEFTIARFVLRASEVNARFRELNKAGKFKPLSVVIVADTFIIDEPQLMFDMTSIVARVLDTTEQHHPLRFPRNPHTGTAAMNVMFGEAPNRRPGVGVHNGIAWFPWQSSSEPNVARGFTADYENGQVHGTEVDVLGGEAGRRHPFYDALRHPQIWNMAKAQFAAATLLFDEPAQRAQVVSMLRWIQHCTTAVNRFGGPARAEAQHMNYQSAALLLFAQGGANARYVPVWSESAIKTRIDDLLAVLRTYEERVRTLEIRSDIQGTVQALSDALRDVSAADRRAIDQSISLNAGDIAAQTKQFKDLLWAYELQEQTVKLRLILFKSGLEQKQLIRTTMAVLEIVGATVQLGVACYTANFPDPKIAQKAAEDAAKQAAEVGDVAAAAGEVATRAMFGGLIDALKKLKTHLELSAKIGVFAAKAAEKVNELSATSGMEGRGTIEMPELAEMGALDPELDWNIFIVKIEVMLNEFITDPDGAGTGAVAGAREYFIALRTLAEYGRALSLKSVALARLQSRALELGAQRQAAEFAIQRWTTLHAEAKTAAEKVSVCRSMLLEASLNTKRSLILLAEGYRAAHAYNNLVETPMRLRLTMDYNALHEEFRSLKNDIASLFVAPANAQEVTTGFFELPVVHATPGATLPPGPHVVLRTPVGAKPTLTWSMPIARPPFEQWLSSTRSAYFVQEARFYLDGAEPDDKGMIGLNVATTGQYHNGYGGPPPVAFVSQGFALDFIYEPANGDAPSSTWKPVGRGKDNYMSPTPFTGWVATIDRAGSLAALKKLRVKLWLVRQTAPTS